MDAKACPSTRCTTFGSAPAASDVDVEALALMLGLAEDIDAAIAVAVKGLRERGSSWAEIGSRLGVTRQAAHQRWG